jgi:hypothetical protein
MPFFMASCDSALVKLTIAAFVGAYASRLALGSNAWIDAVLMIVPPRRHPRQRGAAQPEHRVDVGLERRVELLGGELLDGVVCALEGGVVDENIERAELRERAIDQRVAVSFVANVAGGEDRFAAGFCHPFRGLARVVLFLRQVTQKHVGPLARECNRDSPADAAVPTGDERGAIGETAQSSVTGLAVIRLRRHLRVRPGRIDGLLRILRFRPLCFRVGWGFVLQSSGRSHEGAPPRAILQGSIPGRCNMNRDADLAARGMRRVDADDQYDLGRYG